MRNDDLPIRSKASLCVGIRDTEVEARPDGLWLVQVTSEDMRVMTLHELDAAFRSGMIDEHTLVLPDGTFQWDELGVVAEQESMDQLAIHAR